MCFHYQQSQTREEIEKRFRAKFEVGANYMPAIYNGFMHPQTPVITNKNPDLIQLFHWGLIPNWAKDISIRKQTLNARIETIHEKPSFRGSVMNRCLIPADGFFEWQWLDEKGKNKQKFLITSVNNTLFSFAGLYSQWVDRATGEIMNTFTILTTEANELMAEIHNTKKRMPVILNSEVETDWLLGKSNDHGIVELKAEMV